MLRSLLTSFLLYICHSETSLDSSISSEDNNLGGRGVPGYNLVRTDNPAITKRAGICIYHINSSYLKVTDIKFLNEYVNFKIRIDAKMCNFFSLYGLPSQARGIFETYVDNFELPQNTIIDQNPFLIVALGNFITADWYDTNSYAGLKIDTIWFQFDLHQLMKQYIYFTSKSNLE